MAEQFLGQIQTQRQGQILSPQLRASLELLQVPTQELRTLVQQEMEQNPTLEEQTQELDQNETEPEKPERTAEDDAFDAEFDKLAKLDDEWRDYFNQTQTHSHSKESEERRQHLFDSLTAPESLQQHLMSQLEMSTTDRTKRQLGELVIGSISDEGFLTSTVEELAESTGFEVQQVAGALAVVQDFDPIGVGARDLRECLLIQLRRLGSGESKAAAIVAGHLEALGAKKYSEIARALKIRVESVQAAAKLIATLEPRPGRAFISDEPAYVLPEVTVVKSGGDYVILMNNEQIPRLHISAHYRRLMEDETTKSEVKTYIRDKVRAGMFLIKSIGQRQQTIQNIAREIVKVQREFLEQGLTHLRPLIMADIAAIIGVHETTVSRAISNKYMQTPRGTFEMKYFFNPGYKNADGQLISNRAMKDAIAKLVAEEDSAKPLSDESIMKLLQQQGYTVARRTIAKYRDELKILPSHQRRGYHG